MATRMGNALRFAALAVLGAALLSGSAGCEAGRFPVCDNNDDCKKRDAGAEKPVCYNLKCVQCRYDTDCERGTCSPANECQALATTGERDDPDAGDVPKGWEHGSWDSCAAECKDPSCIKLCDEKFPKSPEQKETDEKKKPKK